MSSTKNMRVADVCEILNISHHTLRAWYNYEKKQLAEGVIENSYLPTPLIAEHDRGKPKEWTLEMVEQLRQHKESIIMGRNGTYGAYSNPQHKQTLKYKKAHEGLES